MVRIFLTALILGIYGAATISFAQNTPSGAEILKNVESTVERVQDYVVDLRATINMERLRVPAMNVTMYFKKPNKIHFESQNFAMLPREGFALNPTVLRDRFDATVIAEETLQARKVYRLKLTAKDTKMRPQQLFLWVDPTNWTAAKIETTPYEGRSLSVAFTYKLYQSSFWLPETLKATFSVAGPDTSTRFSELAPQLAPQFNEMQRPPRSGSVTIVYSNYRINTGLSDEIFEQRPRE